MNMDPEELKKAFEAFKTHNEQRLDEIARQGQATAETVAAVNKASADIDRIQANYAALEERRAADRALIDDLEIRLNREKAGGRGLRLSDEKVERYARWQSAVQRTEVDPAHLDTAFIDAYKAAFGDYIRHGKEGASNESLQVLNAATAGDNPSGGYWVEPDTGGRVIDFMYETSPMYQLASRQTISGDRLQGKVTLGEAGYGWVGETEARPTTSTPVVVEWEVPKREIYAKPEATQNLIDDASIDIAGWLVNGVRRTFTRVANTAFVTGNTPKRPRGFTTYTAGTPGDTAATWQFIEQVASGHATALTADGLLALEGSLKSDFLPNARFGMRRATQTVLRQLKDGNGNYLLVPDFANPARSTLLGYPVEIFADMAAVAAAALPIVFADFASAYQVVDDPRGFRVLVDPFSNKPYVQYYSTLRVGGDVVNFEALKLQVVSA
jgi:HK97 family phage major capsid protein